MNDLGLLEGKLHCDCGAAGVADDMGATDTEMGEECGGVGRMIGDTTRTGTS
jgi:hypothetical protein